MGKTLLFIALLVLTAAAGVAVGYFFGYDHGFERAVPGGPTFTRQLEEPLPTPAGEAVYCTQDAQECPDGSFVGRIGPRCEFAPCPGQ